MKGHGEIGAYLQQVHERVHLRWAKNYVWALVPEKNPFNDKKKRVVTRIAVAPDGALSNVEIKVHSGLAELDHLALTIVMESGPWPRPPASALSANGSAYVEWAFSRDQRLCSDLRFVSNEDPIEDAVPMYLLKKKDDEAWRRISARAASEPDPVLSWFARQWLARALGEPRTATAAAAGLLAAGDTSGLAVVKQTLQQGGAGAPLAAQALRKAKVPLCPLVKENLAKDSGAAQEAALIAMELVLEKECIPALGALAANAKVALPLRMAALKILSASSDSSALEALGALKNDPVPGVRSAALLAGVKLGAGRGVVFKLIPFMKDSNVDVRSAAAAGVVRAAGDAELGQLYLLFKESDPRPYEMVANELAKYPTPATAQLLGKMLKKDDKRIRMAAAKAIVVRGDESAKALVDAVAADVDPDVNAIAQGVVGTAGADAARQLPAAKPADARKLYRQLSAGAGRGAAAKWLLGNFAALDAVAQVEVLGEWLVGAAPGTGVTFATTQP